MALPEGAWLRRRYLYCKNCGRRLSHESRLAFWGCIISLITLGLFLPVWILLHLFAAHWACERCGHKRWGWRTRDNPF